MNPLKTVARLTALLLCASVFAGTAFAGDKPTDGAPGNSGSAPGQVKKEEPKKEEAQPAAPVPQPAAQQPATPPGNSGSAPGQAKKAEQQKARPVEKAAKAAKAEKPAKAAEQESTSNGTGSYKATSGGTDLKKGMEHKHTICHATGSATNPYVVITPSVSGVFNGHIGHQGGEDIIPPFVYEGQTYSQNWDAAGQALFANGCRPAAAAQTTTGTTTTATTTGTTTAAACPGTTQTVTTVERGGVFHKTGNGYVFIQPSLGSAHYDKSKHEDDIIVPDQTVSETVAVPGNCDSTTTTTTGSTTTVTLQNETVTLPGSTTTLPGSTVTIPGQTVTVGGTATVVTGSEDEAGGVLGAQSPPGAGQAGQPAPDAGGVLGSVGSLGETAVTGTLPFTGIPLWIAALVGGGLLAAGLALRRTA